jgi:hypothetical protein
MKKLQESNVTAAGKLTLFCSKLQVNLEALNCTFVLLIRNVGTLGPPEFLYIY